MALRGTLRGAGAAWLGLVTLQVATSRGGSGRIADLMRTVDTFVKRAFSPDVPALPDFSKGGTASPYVSTTTRAPSGGSSSPSPVPPDPSTVPVPPAATAANGYRTRPA